MSYAPALAVSNLLGDSAADHKVAAGFVTGMFIARIPILLFQAVQAALLPKLSAYAGSGQHDDFRAGLKKLLIVVAGVAVLGVVGGATVGPTIGRKLFEKWTLESRDLALLAGGAGGFILALTLAQGLIALRGYKHVAASWVAGILVFLAVMPIGNDVVLSSEIAFVMSCWVTAMIIATLLVLRMRVATATIQDLVGVVEHEQLEI
jgi:O-antigen/teichoic acid export membrane protein